ncbi:hypothetical protein ACQ4PT_028605 [Festuca glaucescens]
MEKVEGMLKNLKLSEAERQSIRIEWKEEGKGGAALPQAVGKLMSEKPALPEALKNTVGKIWCPLKGVTCKDLGENVFRFTFHQVSGWRKALEEGPWMFEGEALVMEDFDAAKTPDEYEFCKIPIWIRVGNLPLGKLDKETGILVGNKVGEFEDVELGEDGLAKGRVLRVKIKLNIKQPLMRGVMVQVGDEQKDRWCPLEYEFLPAFCWTCGLIGHTDKSCAIVLKKGEEQQFGSWMKYTPSRRSTDEEARYLGIQRRGGGRSSSFGGGGNRSNRSGSDILSWRKDANDTEKRSSPGDDREVPSPLKLPTGENVQKTNANQAKKQLLLSDNRPEAMGDEAGDGTGGGFGDEGQAKDAESEGRKPEVHMSEYKEASADGGGPPVAMLPINESKDSKRHKFRRQH